MFVLGRIGELETAGGCLSYAITNITAFAVIYALSMGMDGITPQAYGASNFTLMARTLQRTVLNLLTTTNPITILWLNAKPVLIFVGHDIKVSETAATSIYFTKVKLIPLFEKVKLIPLFEKVLTATDTGKS